MTKQVRPRRRAGERTALAGSVAVVLGLAGIGAMPPAQAAVTTYDPFEVNQGFTWVATGDLALGNGELEGSVAAFGTLQSTTGNFPVVHHAAGMPDYTIPEIDGDPVRLLGGQFVGSGAFDLTNADSSGTLDPSSDEAAGIAKFADTTDLSGQARGSNFTRVTNPEGGVIDLQSLPWDPDTWQDSVTTEQPAVADYFPDVDSQVDRTNQCLAQMYTDPALAHEVTVSGDASQVHLSGFDPTMPNWVAYDDLAGAVVTIDDGYAPTAQAPLVIKVTDPTTTIGPINVQGWSADASQQQDYARYVMLDLSEVTGPVTVDGLELGAVWAPGVDLDFVGSRTTNGQWFADDVTTSGGGEIHHHTFLGELLCDDASPAIDSSVAVAATEDGTLPAEGGTVVDTITYTGLTPGQEYVVTGSLVAADDGADTGITATTTFTPPAADGSVDVTFSVSAAQAAAWAGQDLVAFQVVTLDGDVVAAHEDLADADQTFAVAGQAPATFSVVKEVDGAGAALVPTDTVFTVEFDVVDGPSAGSSGQLDVPADGTTVTWPGELFAGDVVTFDEDAVEVDGVVFAGAVIEPDQVTLSEGVVPVITVTNTYDLAPATFDLRKEITGDAADLVPAGTEFTVDYEVISGTDAGTGGTLTVAADGTVVDGPELTAGDVVSFSEPDLPVVDGVVWGTATVSPDPVVLTADQTVEVTVTNVAVPAQAEGGSVAVAKELDGEGAAVVWPDIDCEDDGNNGGGNGGECEDPPSYEIGWTVVDGPSAGRTGTVTVPADGTAVEIPGPGEDPFAVGDVVELDEPAGPDTDGADLAGVTVDPASVVITADGGDPVQVDVTNTYDLADVTFTAHKEVVGSGAGLVPDDATFDLFYEVVDGPSAGAMGDLELPADGTVVDGPTLLHGDVVELTEATPPAVDGVVWGETTIDPTTLTLDAGTAAVDVTVTNTAAEVTLGSEVTVLGTGGKVLPAEGGTLVDTLTYTGLVPGQEYVLAGVLVTSDGQGTPLRGSTTFTPDQPDGTVEVELTLNAADVADYAGQDLVAFQWLTADGVRVAEHTDVDDAAQTFTVAAESPEIDSRVAVVGSADGVVGRDGATVTDTITYTGLSPGSEYVVTGTLRTTSDGGRTGITGSTTFTPSTADGSVEVVFELSATDAAVLAGMDVVAFQRLSRDGAVVASHEDVADADQTFTVAAQPLSIATSASVVGSSDSKVVPPEGATVVDTVSYTGLTPGVEYVVSGTVMRTDLAGTGIAAGHHFTPTSPDGEVEVSFFVSAQDAEAYAGEYQVVFEGLFVDGHLADAHVDIDDADQTFWIADGSTPDGGGSLPLTGPQSAAALAALAVLLLLAGAALRVVRRRALR